jgi:hypothetical protein
MKSILIVGLIVSSAFFAPAQANDRNGNNECNQFSPSAECLQNKGGRGSPQQPVVVQPQPNPPVVVQNPPQFNNGYGNGYRGDWNRNRNRSGIYLNFQSDPYGYDNSYNQPNYYDDPYYNDEPNYYSDPYPRRYQSYSRTRVTKCTSIARSLRNSGYSRVRNQECTGSSYIYTASRDGERLRLTVSSSSGRILKIRRVY